MMPRLTSTRAAWLAVLSAALAVRLAAGVWWQSQIPAGQQFVFGDSVSYWELGKAIARGDPYEYGSSDQRVFRAPGYPLVLAGIFRIFGDDAPPATGRALSALWGTLAVAIVGWWATQLFNARAGVWAGCLAAFYPGAVSMGAFVLSEAPFCPFMLLHLALWGLAWRSSSRKSALRLAIAGGAAGAIATLMRPGWFFFTPLAIVVGLMTGRPLRQMAIGVTMCATFGLCMLPWWIRNAEVTSRFVGTTLQMGASLYDGLNPSADGGSNMAFVPEFAAAEHEDDLEAELEDDDVFEYRLDQRLTRAAVEWAVANPLRAAELAGIKFVRLWNVWPNEPSLRAWPLRLVVLITYTPLLCLGLLGAWRFTSRGWPYVLAWLPAVYFTAIHVIFVSSIRYREPAMLALAVLAAGVLAGESRTGKSSATAPGERAI